MTSEEIKETQDGYARASLAQPSAEGFKTGLIYIALLEIAYQLAVANEAQHLGYCDNHRGLHSKNITCNEWRKA